MHNASSFIAKQITNIVVHIILSVSFLFRFSSKALKPVYTEGLRPPITSKRSRNLSRPDSGPTNTRVQREAQEKEMLLFGNSWDK